MSRTIAGKPFTVCCTTEVTSIIRGHHVYKEVWDAAIGEMLEAKNNMINTLLVDTKRYPSWTYTNRNFKFIFPFINQDPGNKTKVLITVKRQREIGLVVPTKLIFITINDSRKF